MATTLTGGLRSNITIQDTRTAVSGAANETGVVTVNASASYDVVSGTAAGQMDKVWSDTRTIATGPGSPDVLDVSGILLDAFGAVVTFVKVRSVTIIAGSGNTTTLQLTRPAANGVPIFIAASDALAPLSAGGFAGWTDPNAGATVTPGTGDLIHVINSVATPATYTITIIGTSA